MDEKKLQNDNKQLINIIQAQYPRLSKGQKLIAQYIINNYDKVAFMTASKLGDTVGVSESTVVRFANALGYAGYPKLQEGLQELIKNKLTTVQRVEMANEDYFGFSPLIIIGVFFSFFGLSFLIMVVMAAVVLASSKKNVTKQTAEAPYQDYSFDRKQDYSFEHKEVGGVECNYCHHMNQPGSIYCSQCGEKIKKKVVCPNCKAENDGSSSYCYRCGHRL